MGETLSHLKKNPSKTRFRFKMIKNYFDLVDPKPDFPKMEKDLLDKWYKEGIVKKYLTKNNSSKKNFSFLDGPITVNNPMGVHHAWGRTYKDLWQRYKICKGLKKGFKRFGLSGPLG